MLTRVNDWVKRDKYITKYGFALPNDEAIAKITNLSPIVEVGAGSGYWSKLSHENGCDIIATDDYSGEYSFKMADHFSVENIDAVSAVEKYPDRNVLMIWPSLGDNWARECIENIKSGNYLIFIGEGEGGCVANDEFFEYLIENFEFMEYIEIPQWPLIHDFMNIYRRI